MIPLLVPQYFLDAVLLLVLLMKSGPTYCLKTEKYN